MAVDLVCFMMLLLGLVAVRDKHHEKLAGTSSNLLILQIDSLTHTIKELGFQYFGASANASFAELDAKLAHGRENTEFLKAALEESRQRVEDLKVYLGYTASRSSPCLPKERAPKFLLSECQSDKNCNTVLHNCVLGGCVCRGTVYNTCGCRGPM
ncbi:unnamed protein product [Effrenium voratum]|nr:unnamed protein product [Effrenium voratum]